MPRHRRPRTEASGFRSRPAPAARFFRHAGPARRGQAPETHGRGRQDRRFFRGPALAALCLALTVLTGQAVSRPLPALAARADSAASADMTAQANARDPAGPTLPPATTVKPGNTKSVAPMAPATQPDAATSADKTEKTKSAAATVKTGQTASPTSAAKTARSADAARSTDGAPVGSNPVPTPRTEPTAAHEPVVSPLDGRAAEAPELAREPGLAEEITALRREFAATATTAATRRLKAQAKVNPAAAARLDLLTELPPAYLDFVRADILDRLKAPSRTHQSAQPDQAGSGGQVGQVGTGARTARAGQSGKNDAPGWIPPSDQAEKTGPIRAEGTNPRTGTAEVAGRTGQAGQVGQAGQAAPDSQYLVYVDRRGDRQLLFVAVYEATTGRVHFIGADYVSTGKLRRGEDSFLTPLGVYENLTADFDYRAQGTLNSRGWRGLGVKDSRVWDFGFQQAVRHFKLGKAESQMRLLMHATDPGQGEPRLGTMDSKGCVRVSGPLNAFLDRHGILDRHYLARTDSPSVRWLLRPDRAVVSRPGSLMLVGDSERMAATAAR